MTFESESKAVIARTVAASKATLTAIDQFDEKLCVFVEGMAARFCNDIQNKNISIVYVESQFHPPYLFLSFNNPSQLYPVNSG